MKRPIQQISLLILVLAAFTACQPKRDSVRSAVSPTNPVGVLGGLTNIPTTCGQGQSSMGAIFDSAQPSTFQARVVSLLSATMYPQDIGTVGASIGDTTGVRFTGSLLLDASGNVNPTSSNLKITVYDSIWYNQYIMNPSTEGIPLEFNPSQGAVISGQFNVSTGLGFFQVKDNFGEIRFDGTITSQNFTGTVTFKNDVNVTGQAAATGPLGQFTISSCGIIRR